MSLGECQAALADARQEAAQFQDKYLRAAAAIEGVRRQAERDAATRISERVRGFSARLIEVADNLERALTHAPADDTLRPGVQATLQQLLTALRQEGVTPIAVEPGAAFDPQVHEAIAGHAADVAHDTVVEVSQTGYLLDGVVLRPARVIVATPSADQG
jgi:molecular chaperone GrpE